MCALPQLGVVQFVGAIPSLGDGLWVGVQLDEPLGHSNGRVNGRRYFDCPNKHAGFYAPGSVELAQTEPASVDRDGAADSRSTSPVGGGPGAEVPPGQSGGAGASASSASTGAAAGCVASGRGLHTAVVGLVAQFVVTGR